MEQETKVITRKKLIIALVGLPARGKTLYGRKICKYLNWIGESSRLFSLNDYWRAQKSQPRKQRDYSGVEIFMPDKEQEPSTPIMQQKQEEYLQEARNILKAPVKIPEKGSQAEKEPQALVEPLTPLALQIEELRENALEMMNCREIVMQDIVNYLKNEGGSVAVYDATNYTAELRSRILKIIEPGWRVLFVETVTNDKEFIKANIRSTALTSPDFENFDISAVFKNVYKQCEFYEKMYQKVSEQNDGDRVMFIRVHVGNDGRITTYNLDGFLPGKILTFVLNLHTEPRPIYLVKVGENTFKAQQKLGGDSELSENGIQYAKLVGNYFRKLPEVLHNVLFYTSTMKSAAHQVRTMKLPVHADRYKQLNEIDVGECDGMTYEQLKQFSKQIDSEYRNSDKLRYRYPKGESYYDLIQRIEPMILLIERSKRPLIILAHNAVLKVIYSYFVEEEIEKAPFQKMPDNTIIKLVPQTYQVLETQINFDIQAKKWTESYEVKSCNMEALNASLIGGLSRTSSKGELEQQFVE